MKNLIIAALLLIIALQSAAADVQNVTLRVSGFSDINTCIKYGEVMKKSAGLQYQCEF